MTGGFANRSSRKDPSPKKRQIAKNHKNISRVRQSGRKRETTIYRERLIKGNYNKVVPLSATSGLSFGGADESSQNGVAVGS